MVPLFDRGRQKEEKLIRFFTHNSDVSEALQSGSQISIQAAETDRRGIREAQSIGGDTEDLGNDR